MKNKLPLIAAGITLWTLVFGFAEVARRLIGPGTPVRLGLAVFPVGYALAWHLYRRAARRPVALKCSAPFLFYLNFFVSDCLQFCNPFALVFVIAQLLALITTRATPNLSEPVSLRFPFRGTWLVGTGGTTRATSHSWSIIAQRYAHDFVIGPSMADTSLRDGGHLTDYPAYGQPILAPIDGKVVSVRSTSRDSSSPGTGWTDWWTRDPRGNHVLIEYAAGHFVLLAHLRQGSVLVRPGQFVEASTPIGECGNSGRSTEPHLHLHCQRGRSFAFGVGLPIAFADKTTTAAASLERGRQVSPSEN